MLCTTARRYVLLHSLPSRGAHSQCAAPRLISALLLLLTTCIPAIAQFKEIGPAPMPPAAARQQIIKLIANLDATNRKQTVTTLSGLVVWYRDILDDELIAAWKTDARANLPDLIETLADAHLASAIIDFSWREQREAAFTPAYAPMFGHLMERYPAGAKPFLDDLTASPKPPNLTPSEAAAVCRILIDMPDLGTWKRTALQILPAYRAVTDSLLAQDQRSTDQERVYRAQRWVRDLKSPTPASSLQSRAIPVTQPVTPPITPPPVRPKETAPTVILKVEPVYSETANKLRADGASVISALVGLDGKARDLIALSPIGYGLDESAIDAIRKWEFKPGTRDGKPAEIRASIRVNFKIRRDPANNLWYSSAIAFPAYAGMTSPVVKDGLMPKPDGPASSEALVLGFTVDADGNVRNIHRVSGSQTSADFMTPYLATWKFVPATSGDHAIESAGTVRFTKGDIDQPK